MKKDPNADIDLEISNLLTESQHLSMQLSQIIEHLVTPSQMAGVLESVLEQQSGIHLVSLQTLPSEPITEDKEASQYSGYYVHPVRMELTGDYFSIANYLNKLESLPASYFWRSFSYKVEEYPKAKLVLEVYTLGSRGVYRWLKTHYLNRGYRLVWFSLGKSGSNCTTWLAKTSRGVCQAQSETIPLADTEQHCL